jgi:hypothetical protein
MRLSVCTKSSSDGSRRRRCCHQRKRPRCCFGRCLLLVRSACERSMGGGLLQKHPSVSQLTSPPDSVLSKCRRSRHRIPTPIATTPRCSIIITIHVLSSTEFTMKHSSLLMKHGTLVALIPITNWSSAMSPTHLYTMLLKGEHRKALIANLRSKQFKKIGGPCATVNCCQGISDPL